MNLGETFLPQVLATVYVVWNEYLPLFAGSCGEGNSCARDGELAAGSCEFRMWDSASRGLGLFCHSSFPQRDNRIIPMWWETAPP